MKKTVFFLLSVFVLTTMTAQVGVGSITIVPISGTNDVELSINSNCLQVHNLAHHEYTNTTAGSIVNLCYADTGLLLETAITSRISLPGINTSGTQNITVNAAYYHYLDPSETCASNPISGTPVTLTFEAPLTQARTFTLGKADLETKKISLYPNPNNGSFSIDLPLDVYNAAVSVSDLSGKTIFNDSDYSSGTIIQLESLASGLYFAKITHNQVMEIVKFVVK